MKFLIKIGIVLIFANFVVSDLEDSDEYDRYDEYGTEYDDETSISPPLEDFPNRISYVRSTESPETSSIVANFTRDEMSEKNSEERSELNNDDGLQSETITQENSTQRKIIELAKILSSTESYRSSTESTTTQKSENKSEENLNSLENFESDDGSGDEDPNETWQRKTSRESNEEFYDSDENEDNVLHSSSTHPDLLNSQETSEEVTSTIEIFGSQSTTEFSTKNIESTKNPIETPKTQKESKFYKIMFPTIICVNLVGFLILIINVYKKRQNQRSVSLV